jgi:hypothetical protein
MLMNTVRKIRPRVEREDCMGAKWECASEIGGESILHRVPANAG